MRIGIPICALAAAFALTRAGAACAQVLNNPGFEKPGQTLVSSSDKPSGKAQISGTIAEGWGDNTDWADVALTYSLDNSQPHSGRYAQKIEVRRGFAQFVQSVRLSKGRYRAALWMRAASPLWVSLSLREAGAPYTSFASRPARVDTRWTRVEVSGSIPQDTNCLLLVNTGAGTGTLFLDDAELGPAGGTTAAVTLNPPRAAVPRPYFGLNINHMHDPEAVPWPAVPFGTYRTWDSGIVWASIEPKRGEFAWTRLDKDVTEAKKRGTEILLTLGFPPRWASSDPNNTSSAYGAPGATAPPADVNDWKNFLRAVATRYKGRIRAYEVWNEADQPGHYSGTPAQLVGLEKAAREVLRAADPSALVVTPAVSGVSAASLKWMDDYLAAGGGASADVVAVHFYGATPEEDAAFISQFRALLAAYPGMAKKPVWKTETGWGFDGKGSDAEVSAYVARAAVLNWAAGMERFCWYSWSDKSLVGVRRDADGKFTVLTPAAVAYRQAGQWLTGSRMLSCAGGTNGVWTCALRRPDGTAAWIVWDATLPPGQSRPFPVPAAWKVTHQQDLTGRVSPVARGTVSLSASPLLLTTAPSSPRK
jgi:hypothetical protein